MPAPAKLAAFTALLAAVFGVAALAGGAVDPDRTTTPAEHAGGAAPAHGVSAHAPAQPVRGLAVAENGLRIVVADPELRRGRTEPLRFRIVEDETGETVRAFDVEHTKRMHLIVARRDLTGFQHLHPTQAPDGTWSTPVRLPDAGTYRVFADFSHDGEPTTLASDLRVSGPARLRALPAPATTATTGDGYVVVLDRHGSELRFTVTRGGQTVDVEPYLGANGHLVALREGDLAFLHVHPSADDLSFETTFPTAGRYRLFLQFRHAGSVHTAAFTQEDD